MTSSAVVCFPSPNNDTDLSFPIRRKIRSCRETNDSCSGAENIQDELGTDCCTRKQRSYQRLIMGTHPKTKTKNSRVRLRRLPLVKSEII